MVVLKFFENIQSNLVPPRLPANSGKFWASQSNPTCFLVHILSLGDATGATVLSRGCLRLSQCMVQKTHRLLHSGPICCLLGYHRPAGLKLRRVVFWLRRAPSGWSALAEQSSAQWHHGRPSINSTLAIYHWASPSVLLFPGLYVGIISDAYRTEVGHPPLVFVGVVCRKDGF